MTGMASWCRTARLADPVDSGEIAPRLRDPTTINCARVATARMACDG